MDWILKSRNRKFNELRIASILHFEFGSLRFLVIFTPEKIDRNVERHLYHILKRLSEQKLILLKFMIHIIWTAQRNLKLQENVYTACVLNLLISSTMILLYIVHGKINNALLTNSFLFMCVWNLNIFFCTRKTKNRFPFV